MSFNHLLKRWVDLLLQINLLTYILQFFRSALTEGLLETAINEFQSFVKEMVGFVVTNQSFDIYLPIFQVCTD